MPVEIGIADLILNQSFTCESYQETMVDLLSNTQFDEKLAEFQKKAERLKKATDKLNKQMSQELAKATDATIQETETLIEAAKDTGEMSVRCAIAIRFPKDSRKIYKCIEEIFEATDAVGEFIDKHDDAQTQRILLKVSSDLKASYKELKKEWEKQKAEPIAVKGEFERRCAVLLESCVRGHLSVEKIPIILH